MKTFGTNPNQVLNSVLADWEPIRQGKAIYSVDYPVQRSGIQLGMNLAHLTYYSREWSFTNIMQRCMPWITQNVHYAGDGSDTWDTGYKDQFRFDSNGYPLECPINVPGRSTPQCLATLIYRDCSGHYPKGTYHIRYAGDGDFEVGFDAVNLRRQADNSYLFDVTNPSDAGILLKITRSNPSNPISSIRISLLELEQEHLHPLFISTLNNSKVLRFMDWMRTNDSPVVGFDSYKPCTYYTFDDEAGVPISWIGYLSRMMHHNPWINIPHKATDDCIRQLAEQLLNGMLDSNQLDHETLPLQTIYVEYSNECWNGQFQQYHWLANHPALNEDTFPKNYAVRAKHCFEVFCNEIHRIAPQQKVIRVLGGQHLNPWFAQNAMEILNGSVDAISCAAYFGPATQDFTNVDELIVSCKDWIGSTCIPNLQAHADLAAQYKIDFITYEAGQHMTAYGHQDDPKLPLYLEAQTHPGIYDCYKILIQALDNMGCKLFTAYNFVSSSNQWGSWGHLLFQDSPIEDSPKFKALAEI